MLLLMKLNKSVGECTKMVLSLCDLQQGYFI